MNGTAEHTKDIKGRELSEGDEVEIVNWTLAKNYVGHGSLPPPRFRIAAIDADDTIQDRAGFWIPAQCVALVADVTAPEPAIPGLTVAALPPGLGLPPNPKAAYGAQKPDLSLIPPVADLHMAMALENGAGKYGAFNWREKAVEARTYVAAAKRHLDAWLDGQENSDDTDPPVHNLGHAMACCAIILDAKECGNLIDNRPKAGKAAEVQSRMKAAKVAAKGAK